MAEDRRLKHPSLPPYHSVVPDHLALGPCCCPPTNALAQEHRKRTVGGVYLGATQHPNPLRVLEELPPSHLTVWVLWEARLPMDAKGDRNVTRAQIVDAPTWCFQWWLSDTRMKGEFRIHGNGDTSGTVAAGFRGDHLCPGEHLPKPFLLHDCCCHFLQLSLPWSLVIVWAWELRFMSYPIPF